MQVTPTPPQSISELTLKTLLAQDFSRSQTLSYHELESVPVREVNELAQMAKNIESLSLLRSKIQFMSREIRYLMKV